MSSPVEAPIRSAVALDVYGFRISVEGDWPEVIEGARLDFEWFEASREPGDLVVRVERGPPAFDRFGDLEATFVTPRNVVYQAPDHTVVDYFGRALAVLTPDRSSAWVQGEDPGLVHEVIYHLLLSAVGRHLDAAGLTRLHGLGVTGAQGGVVVMLPSGGGKSTLALHALQEPGIGLISEDSPLLDRRGRLHPFPLRIGVNATDADRLPPGSTRTIERMEFHPKVVLSLDGFRDRVPAGSLALKHLVVGRRSLAVESRLEPLPSRAAVGSLLREAVVGVGIYQGMEFILQRGIRDVAFKAGTVAGRAARCAAALGRAQTWSLTLGRDQERNWQELLPLLR
jgi:hypothetical protein